MGGVITGVNVVWVQVRMRGSGLSGNWCHLGTTCVFYGVFSEDVNFAASVSGNDVCASLKQGCCEVRGCMLGRSVRP
jgi:hypothetical protein